MNLNLYKICFIIAHKYVIGYDSYIKIYIENIQRFYPNSHIIVVDNKSETLPIDFSCYNNLTLLTNNSDSFYELGAYKYAMQYIMQNNMFFNYFVFTQDTFFLINPYDFNILNNNNITACSIVNIDYNNHHMHNMVYNIKLEYMEETKKILEPLGLFNEIEKFTICWGSNFIIKWTKLIQLYNYIKDTVLTIKKHSEYSERYLSKIIYELNGKRDFNIDGTLDIYSSLMNTDEALGRLHFLKIHQFKP